VFCQKKSALKLGCQLSILASCISLTAMSFVTQAHAGIAAKSLALEKEKWVVLSYSPSSQITPNDVKFIDSKITVKSKSSAGPIVFKLPEAQVLTGFSIKGSWQGLKKVEVSSFDEDSVLRMGLVATGSQTLSWGKRFFAPDWIKKLFALAPAGEGLDKIYFFNLSNRPELIGRKRIHPKSDLISEEISQLSKSEGDFLFDKMLSEPLRTTAIWMSIDSDDSKSEFTTSIQNIELKLSD
jgi:hypothetical protein